MDFKAPLRRGFSSPRLSGLEGPSLSVRGGACAVLHKGKPAALDLAITKPPTDNSRMKLKAKFLLLAVAPLLLATLAIGTLFVLETASLQKQQQALLEETLLNAKRDELRNYISLALTSIDRIYDTGRDDDAAKEEVKSILAGMTSARTAITLSIRRRA
jgi:hypothetical protein